MGLESESGEVTIPVEESTGEIKIANDVVATIAALAATETKGRSRKMNLPSGI